MSRNYAGGPTANELFDLAYTAGETLLLLSSLAGGLALLALAESKPRPTLLWLAVTFLLGLGFVTMELSDFHSLIQRGGSGPKRFPIGLLYPGWDSRPARELRYGLDTGHDTRHFWFSHRSDLGASALFPASRPHYPKPMVSRRHPVYILDHRNHGGRNPLDSVRPKRPHDGAVIGVGESGHSPAEQVNASTGHRHL
jgi:hypothetical protein